MVLNRSWPAVSHFIRTSGLVPWQGYRNIGELGVSRSEASPSCRQALLFGFSVGHCLAPQALPEQGAEGWKTYEVYTDRGDVGLCVGIVGESQKEAGLADTGISDEQELEEVVVPGGWLEIMLVRSR
jgi:hypothetical protein